MGPRQGLTEHGVWNMLTPKAMESLGICPGWSHDRPSRKLCQPNLRATKTAGCPLPRASQGYPSLPSTSLLMTNNWGSSPWQGFPTVIILEAVVCEVDLVPAW